MKRTRRVEVIRYSRRSTVMNNDATFDDLTAEQVALELLLEIPRAIDAPETSSEPGREGALAPCGDADVAQKRRSLNFLKRLIRG